MRGSKDEGEGQPTSPSVCMNWGSQMTRLFRLVAVIWVCTFSLAAAAAHAWKPFAPVASRAGLRPLELLTSLLQSNLLVIVLLISGALTLGALTVMQLVWTAVVFGLQVGSLASSESLPALLSATLPHSFLELPCFWLAGEVGFKGSGHLRQYMMHGETPGPADLGTLYRASGLVCIIIACAALVESFITPLVMGG